MKSILLAPLMLGTFSTVSLAQDQSDHQAIIEAVHDYALGVAQNDQPRIENAFVTPKAQLKLVLNKNGRDTVFNIPIQDLMEKVWLKLPKSPNHKVDVVNLYVVEGRYASITINNNNEFLDMLSLYKLDGEWKIVDKLAIRHPDAPPSNLDLEATFGPQD